MLFVVSRDKWKKIESSIESGDGWKMKRKVNPKVLTALSTLPTLACISCPKLKKKMWAEIYEYIPLPETGRGPMVECYMRRGC